MSVDELKMFTRTSSKVTNKAILPGMASVGITKLIHEMQTKSPDVMWLCMMCLLLCLESSTSKPASDKFPSVQANLGFLNGTGLPISKSSKAACMKLVRS